MVSRPGVKKGHRTPSGEWTRQQIIEFIIDSTEERGYPPSVREIGKEVGLTSSATIHHHLDRLITDGKLSRVPGQARTIRVTT
jgi:repressor LexA